MFEEPNDENSTVELINLKKDICNISHDSTSLKIGTKNKIIALLKSCHDIVKKKKLQLSYQARLNRLDKCRSTSSSSTNNSASDSEISFEQYHKSLKESITQLLTQLTSIHDATYTNVTVNDFKVIMENRNDYVVPVCSIQCLCRDRIKLYLKNQRFQLSNFKNHLTIVNNKLPSLIHNKNHELNYAEQELLDHMDSDDQLLRSESNQSIT